MEVAEGQWVGEESIFNEDSKVPYILQAKTKLVVLEIASSDLK
jgi:hypothetical protein